MNHPGSTLTNVTISRLARDNANGTAAQYSWTETLRPILRSSSIGSTGKAPERIFSWMLKGLVGFHMKLLFVLSVGYPTPSIFFNIALYKAPKR